MTQDEPKNDPKTAQEQSKYSASDANKNNQKENAHPPGKKTDEGKVAEGPLGTPQSGASSPTADRVENNPGGQNSG